MKAIIATRRMTDTNHCGCYVSESAVHMKILLYSAFSSSNNEKMLVVKEGWSLQTLGDNVLCYRTVAFNAIFFVHSINDVDIPLTIIPGAISPHCSESQVFLMQMNCGVASNIDMHSIFFISFHKQDHQGAYECIAHTILTYLTP